MDQTDLDFIVDSLLFAIVSNDNDGFQIMFDWGLEMVGGSPKDLLEEVRAPLIKRGEHQAVTILEQHLANESR